MARHLPAVLVLTDRHLAAAAGHSLPQLVASLAGLDVAVVLREKDLPPDARAALAGEVAEAASRAEVPLLLASTADLALRFGVAGVHLSASDLPASCGIVGRSCHDAFELAAAAAERVDYVTLSPVFATPTKPGHGPALGLERLARLTGAATVPVYALGGIGPGSAGDCVRAGARGVAVLGAAMRAADPVSVLTELVDEVRAARSRSPTG